MVLIGAAAALALIALIFTDTFEMVILPRRVKHAYRLGPSFYQFSWFVWRRLGRLLPRGRWRNGFLSVFGPASLFALMGVWALGLIFGFALLHWSLGTDITIPAGTEHGFQAYFYMSGTTFFTLGYGDVVPLGVWGRSMTVTEAGIGFGFLAVVIGYLPVLYQAFSKREVTISLLDARFGSPPSAGEYFRRLGESRTLAGTTQSLMEWERWAAELLESHLSYPVLGYYRSQHDNQSWVGALTAILDASSVLIVSLDGAEGRQARLTFAMARHAAVDLGLVVRIPLVPPPPNRLTPERFEEMLKSLKDTGATVRAGAPALRALDQLRSLYEPIMTALAAHFQFTLPEFSADQAPVDNWQSSPWMQRSPSLGGLSITADHDVHFD